MMFEGKQFRMMGGLNGDATQHWKWGVTKDDGRRHVEGETEPKLKSLSKCGGMFLLTSSLCKGEAEVDLNFGYKVLF